MCLLSRLQIKQKRCTGSKIISASIVDKPELQTQKAVKEETGMGEF
jgi:hypothetical protein